MGKLAEIQKRAFSRKQGMTKSSEDTTIGVPKDLKRRFEDLSTSKSYRGFAEFCREAIRDKIASQEEKNDKGSKK